MSGGEWRNGSGDVFLWVPMHGGTFSLPQTVQTHYCRPKHQLNPGPGVLSTPQRIMGSGVQT